MSGVLNFADFLGCGTLHRPLRCNSRVLFSSDFPNIPPRKGTKLRIKDRASSGHWMVEVINAIENASRDCFRHSSENRKSLVASSKGGSREIMGRNTSN